MSGSLFKHFPGNENEVYMLHGLLREEIEEYLGLEFQFE